MDKAYSILAGILVKFQTDKKLSLSQLKAFCEQHDYSYCQFLRIAAGCLLTFLDLYNNPKFVQARQKCTHAMELLAVVAVGLGDSAKVEQCLEHIVNSACRVVGGLWTYKFDHRRMVFKEMPTVLC